MRDRLLVRLFLQRFLDHDFISSEADRRETLATIAGTLVAVSLFLAVLLALKYQFNMFLPPGLTALFSLDDRFLLVSASMLVMALVAVAQWDSLALDARDGAVLGVLPVPQRMIGRTKCAAVVLWAAGFTVAWAIAPTLLRPAALPVKLPVGGAGVLVLMLAHGVTSIGAGAFGFLAVLGLRESLRALLGNFLFRWISPGLQASLIVACTTGLLLLPSVYSGVGRDWLSAEYVSPLAVPALWFVGLHERLAGWVLDELPRGTVPRFFARTEPEATALYRALRPQLQDLGTIAMAALVGTAVITGAFSVWNARRLPTPAPLRGPAKRMRQRFGVRLVTRLIARQPPAQAGFFFALQTLSRSASHRITLASSLAFGLAVVIVSSNARLFDAAGTARLPLTGLAAQSIVLAAVTAGFRHAIRVPAELRANWTFKMSCVGTMRAYIGGVKKAGWFGLILPALVVMAGIDLVVLGAWLAFLHFTLGLLVSWLFLEAAFLGYYRLPFASAYVPDGRLRILSVPAVLGAVGGAFLLAWLERAAFPSLTGFGALLGVLVGLAIAVRVLDTTWRRPVDMPDLDEGAALPTQRFTLAG